MAAVAGSDIVAVILDFNESTLRFKVGNDGFSCLVSVHARIFRIIVGDLCIVCHNIDNLKVMAQTDFKVVGVVSGSDFNNARSEIHFNIFIGNNGNLTVYYGQDKSFADYILVSFIVRVDRNGGIAEQSLGSCCCKLHIAASVLERIAKMPEMTRLILIFNLCV